LLPTLIEEAMGICVLQKLHGTIFLFDPVLSALSDRDLSTEYILKAPQISIAIINTLTIPILFHKQ